MAENTNINNEDFYFEIIAKELNGEISEQEKASLLEWVNKGDGNRLAYENALKNWKITAVSNDIPEFNTEAAWLTVKAKTKIADTKEEGQSISNSKFSFPYKIAASIILIVGIFFLLKFSIFNAPEALNFTTLENELKIYLPDSSEVILNKNSRITYYTDYDSEKRKVFLEGEAFFKVKKSPDKKFEVIGVRSITTVLGTSFSVRSIKGEEKEIVQVVTGRVSFADNLSKEKNEIILTPGFKGTLDQHSNLTKTEVKFPEIVAWKDKRLTFENSAIAQVKEALEMYFNIKVEVNDPLLLNCRFTGSFDKPKIEEIMEVLAVSTNSSYKRINNRFILSGKGCTKK